eukprot:1159037-Pelagomonas_calceolata.AAC.6
MEGKAVADQQLPLPASPDHTALAHPEPYPASSTAARAQPVQEGVQAGGKLGPVEPRGTQEVSPAASTVSSPSDYVLVGHGQEQSPRPKIEGEHQGGTRREGSNLSPSGSAINCYYSVVQDQCAVEKSMQCRRLKRLRVSKRRGLQKLSVTWPGGNKQAAPGPEIVDNGGPAESGGGLRHRQIQDASPEGADGTKARPSTSH